MAVWPATLPQDLNLEGFEGQISSQVVRTPMDVGPAKQRLRSSSAPEPFRGIMVMTKDQFALFNEFFQQTIGGGADEFDWKHPITLVAKSVRFIEQPRYRAITPTDISVTMALEIMP